MAKKNTASKQSDAQSELIQQMWEATYKSEREHRQMAAQFFAIGEQLGWRGPASDLAKTGQQSADAFAAKYEQRCNELRDMK